MASTNYPNLLQSLQIGNNTIQNRVTVAALTRNRSINTVTHDLNVEYYRQRARGGAGLIVTEGLLISRQGTEWADAPGLWDEALHVPGWKKIVDAVHEEGGKIYAQLWHAGRAAHPDAPQQRLAGEPVWAPSALSARGGQFRFLPDQPGYTTPSAIPDPRKIIEQYRDTALLARKAGFDGVELHSSNGFLPHQFLDSTSNQRTDQWGGSIENRARFGLEAIKALKSVFGDDVAVKYSPAGGFNDMGMPLEETIETYSYMIAEAQKLGVAYITLTRYVPQLDPEYEGKKRATPMDVLATFRPLIISPTKLFANGAVLPEEGEQLVKDSIVDAVAIGINWIAHPDLVKRMTKGKMLDNQPRFEHFYPGGGKDMHVGYTDYPEADY